MSNDKKVLLRISNLKQWFPLKKRGMYVKANDGIDLEIYEGETFGLVGESGCGKSTFGRTILQVYPQTDGRTMYYGRTIDELCPEYIRETIKTLDKRRKHLAQLEEKRDHLQAEYDAMSDEDKLKHHNDLAAAKKKAHDALLDITNVIGGFIVVEDLAPVSEQFLKINKLSKQLHKLHLKERSLSVELADILYKSSEDSPKAEAAQKKVDDIRHRLLRLKRRLQRSTKYLIRCVNPIRTTSVSRSMRGIVMTVLILHA